MTKLSKAVRNMAIVASILALAAACSQEQPVEAAESSGTSKVVARFDGEPITDDDLDIRGELTRLEQEAYKARQEALDGVITVKVLEKEAKKNGIDVEELLKANVDSTVAKPTPAEVRAFYEQRKSRFRKPFEEVEEQAATILEALDIREAPAEVCRRTAKGQQGRDSDLRAAASRQSGKRPPPRTPPMRP